MITPLIQRILEIILVPYDHSEVLWTIAPLLFGLIMLETYFGKYKTEQLGWNTAFGNTISLMWVTFILLRFSHETYGLSTFMQETQFRGYLIIIIAFGLLTMFLAIMNFQHRLPRKFAFLISSSLPINGLAYFAIVIVMGTISLDWTTLWAIMIIFAVLTIVFKIYKKSITPPKSELPTLKKREHEKKKLERKIEQKIVHKIKKIEEPIFGTDHKNTTKKTGKKKL